MDHILPQINMRDFHYDLPEARIAQYPLAQRDASKLLHWHNGQIEHLTFRDLPDLMSGSEILYFNDTKVIPARLFFEKPTGARIEIFLLTPVAPAVVESAMQQTTTCTWQCTIGNLKSWKDGQILTRMLDLDGKTIELSATLTDRSRMEVRLDWTGDVSLPTVLQAAGQMPIPPYLRRQAEASDATQYQTVYSQKEGAVAAPTAGLHFTEEVLARLDQKGVQRQHLTLHVSAGTFQPVKVDNAIEHAMHFEQVVLKRSNLEALLGGASVVVVGTTAMRTLESVYWYGVRLLQSPDAPFSIEKTDAYLLPQEVTLEESIKAVLARMTRDGADELHGQTQLYIMPGYRFRVVRGLVTNFHQPGSTLLLLVAAFTGGGSVWKDIYQNAMQNGYRFLSYGDSSYLKETLV
jgi:S-adenosylmethionine:tRNA ribosyltransferase-isomerase